MPRPYVHINCAATIDGRIATAKGDRLRISCREDIERVHELRQQLGAIMVGANTVLADDPKLTVKAGIVPDPSPLTKIVIDGMTRVPPSSRFLRTEGRSIIYASAGAGEDRMEGLGGVIEAEGLDAEIRILEGKEGRLDIDDVLSDLLSSGTYEVLVEGGSSLIGQLVVRKAYDRFTVYIGPLLVGGGPGIVSESEIGPLPLEIGIRSSAVLGKGLLLELERG